MINDEGLRVLQTKAGPDTPPKRLRTRKADVRKPLWAVADLIDTGHAVLFDADGSYAMHKKTKSVQKFRCEGKGWKVDFDIEAPDKASEVLQQLVAEIKAIRAPPKQHLQLAVSADGKAEIMEPSATHTGEVEDRLGQGFRLAEFFKNS